MNPIAISTRREVCWDEALIDTAAGISVQMHKPEYRGVALLCDEPWEGNCSGYFTVIQDNSKIRLYYRGADLLMDEDGNWVTNLNEENASTGKACYAESHDGKTFTKQNLGMVSVWGNAENNILVKDLIDNFVVFKDENPACPKDALFKALSGMDHKLWLYKSADGVHFEKVGQMLDEGAYDSMNVAFWDKTRQQYYLYYRGLHYRENAAGEKWDKSDTGEGKEIVRDIRVRTSPDFVHWSEPEMLAFGEEQEEYQLYTNQIKPYYRAPHVFLGMPTRYTERLEDKTNFRYLPDRRHRADIIRLAGRSGFAMTDSILMTTRDGLHFRRTDEAFFTPGIEDGTNWYYGDCYPTLGMIETESDRPGCPKEISIYCHSRYRVKNVELERYAVRLDGFFSWHCDYKTGTLLTKPLTFGGSDLEINFATSALGFVRILLCDENGNALPDFDSGRLFGDSVSRPVDFAGDAESLVGKPVRMCIEMSDADLYSFRFNTKSPI